MKKFISVLSATAIAASAIVVPISASAEVGDTLISQNFDSAEPWGASVAQENKKIGIAYVDSATIENVPSSVTGNVFNFNTDGGNNGYTGTVTLGTQAADANAYNISFDAYIKNAMYDSYGYNNNTDPIPENYIYNFGFGAGSSETDIIEFCVKGGDIYLVSGGENVDTGLDTGNIGTWFNVQVFADVESNTISGTITGTDGSIYTIEKCAMAGANAGKINSLFVSSTRTSGSEKGYVNNYIDNFVVKEAAPLQNTIVSYTVNAVDANGNVLKKIKEDTTVQGTSVTVYSDYAFIANGKYYVTNDAEKNFDIISDNQIETITYTESEATGAVYDFEDGVSALTGTRMTIDSDSTISDSNVAKITSASDAGTSKMATAVLDFSSVTADKDTVYVSYDTYVTDSADAALRMIISLFDTTSGMSNTNTGLISIGSESNHVYNVNGKVADGFNKWVHTTVKVNLKQHKLYYAVTETENGFVLGAGSKDIDENVTKVQSLAFISWLTGSAYLDNVTVIAEGAPIAVTTIAPETPSTVQGSDINLVPSTAAETISENFGDAEGTPTEVLNHSNAKPITAANNIPAYSTSARGYSIYAVYDVYVGVDSTIEAKPYGDSGKAEGSTLQLISDAIGNVTVKAITGSGKSTTAPETLAHDTWYRVLMETPQSGTSEAPVTDNLTYTIYRIDAENPTEVTEVAAQLTGLSPRGLASKGVSAYGISVTGTGYTDNGATFRAANGLSLLKVSATPEPAGTAEGSSIDLAADARATIAPFTTVESTTSEKVLNHSSAKQAVTGTVDAYSADAKGNAIYAAYDILVNKGDKFSIAAVNDGDVTSLGTTFVLTGNEDGTASASALVNKGDTVNIEGNLVCGTWYRVVIEVPQTSDGKTENSTYTIYRINGSDSSKTTEIAAQGKNLTPRNLENKGITAFEVSVEGTPYIDNGVTYLKKSSANTWYRYFFTVGDNGVKTVTSIEEIDDPAKSSDKLGKEYYIWNSFMQPYVPAAAETTDTPAEL